MIVKDKNKVNYMEQTKNKNELNFMAQKEHISNFYD